jgi:hypothetical protein
MKYAVEMGSCVMYAPSFITDWFNHSEVNLGDVTQTAWGSHKPTLIFISK